MRATLILLFSTVIVLNLHAAPIIESDKIDSRYDKVIDSALKQSEKLEIDPQDPQAIFRSSEDFLRVAQEYKQEKQGALADRAPRNGGGQTLERIQK